MENNQIDQAVDILEKALNRYDYNDRLFVAWHVKLHYLLGRAYEESGWNKMAIEQYKTFLEIWQDADPGIIEVEDARERLARLLERK